MRRPIAAAGLLLLGLGLAAAEGPVKVLTGGAAFGDWTADAPGVRRHITADSLPAPYATRSVGHAPRVVSRPDGALPKVPPGFSVSLYASGLTAPRLMRTAPNGDVFVAEMAAGRIKVLRAGAGAKTADRVEVFAEHLALPFGIAFYPAGPDPHWVYVANTDSIVRFPYRSGDVKARGPAETILDNLPTGGHVTRDLAFSADGSRLFVSVGSASNVAESLPKRSEAEVEAYDRARGATGAAWGSEELRADVLSLTPEGKDLKTFATGIRNCVGLALQPKSGELWCSTNERDQLGDDLPSDYITRVRAGAFYGWPWYYIGAHEDPRLKGRRPDLAGKVTVPDVLIQAHSASLQLAFYTGSAFPREYRGDIFAAEHGSWNRSRRTGYKVIRVILKDGVPTGEYEDFMTGFVIDESEVWARPVGVTVAQDGALLVSEDGNGTIWRVAYGGN